jgi:hypothetical protein
MIQKDGNLFTPCPECKTANSKYYAMDTDNATFWTFRFLCCECGNDFSHEVRLGTPEMLNPKKIAQLLKDVQKELTDEDVERFRVK